MLLTTCAFFTSIVQAQPEKLIVHQNGDVEIVHNNPPLNKTGTVSIGKIPVFTKLEDGNLVSGVLYRGFSESGNHWGEYPGRIVRQSDGSWIVKNFVWSVAHGPQQFPHDWILSGSDFVQLVDPSLVEKDTADGEIDRIAALTWDYSHVGAPADVSESDARLSILRVMSSFMHLLSNDTLNLSFKFKWETPAPPSTAVAWTFTVGETKELSYVRNTINANYAASLEDSDPFESGLYINFPAGNSINYYRFSGPGVTEFATTTDLYLTLANINTLNSIPPEQQIEIFINSKVGLWDAHPQDGVRGGTSPTRRLDFAGVLTHEVGHSLGFSSLLEANHWSQAPGSFPVNYISHLDVYRFPDSLGQISPTFFRSALRELRDNADANAALQINSTDWLKPLSTGSTFLSVGTYQASHWLNNTLLTPPNSPRIGIMDPDGEWGSLLIGGTYLQPSEIRAMDLLGYDIDSTNTLGITDLPLLAGPISDQSIDASQPLAFTWTQDSTTTEVKLIIYDLGFPNEMAPLEIPNSSLTFSSESLTTNSLTIQSSEIVLIPGHRYQWHVAAFHPLGLNISEPSTFIVDGEIEPIGPCADQFESAKLLPPNGGNKNEYAGFSIAIAGDVIVVGADAEKNDIGIGRAYVYRRDGSRWIYETTLLAPVPDGADYFGGAVATDGNLIVVGAYGASAGDGEVYIYRHDGVDWVQEANLTENGTTWYGRSVSMSGTKIVVGASESDRAYIYKYDGDSWVYEDELVPLDSNGQPIPGSSDYFGNSVSMDNDVVIVGAYNADATNGTNSGATYVYRFNGNSWDQEARLSDGSLDFDADFGHSVSVSDGKIVVGAWKADTQFNNGAGAVYVYENVNSNWNLQVVIEDQDGSYNDRFGDSVYISGDTIAVGADQVDAGSTNSGAVFSYHYDGAVWEQRNRLLSSVQTGDEFLGHSVAVSGDTIAAGAWLDSSIQQYAGSASVFELDPCPADLTDDGILNFFDVSAFLQEFNSQTDLGDWNCDGAWNAFDVLGFTGDIGDGCS